MGVLCSLKRLDILYIFLFLSHSHVFISLLPLSCFLQTINKGPCQRVTDCVGTSRDSSLGSSGLAFALAYVNVSAGRLDLTTQFGAISVGLEALEAFSC